MKTTFEIYPKSNILNTENTNKKEVDNDDKENNRYVNVNITPGAMILTPKAKSIGPTPDRSVSKILFRNIFALILKFNQGLDNCCIK